MPAWRLYGGRHDGTVVDLSADWRYPILAIPVALSEPEIPHPEDPRSNLGPTGEQEIYEFRKCRCGRRFWIVQGAPTDFCPAAIKGDRA